MAKQCMKVACEFPESDRSLIPGLMWMCVDCYTIYVFTRFEEWKPVLWERVGRS